MANNYVYPVVVAQDRDQRDHVVGVYSQFKEALAKAEQWRETGVAEYIQIYRVALDAGYGPTEGTNTVGSAGYEMYSWFEEH